MAIDVTGTYRYKIGWNIGSDGIATSSSSVTKVLMDPLFGGALPAQGGGVAFAQL
jgi:hypothetical protein